MLDFQHENRGFSPKTPKNLEAPRKMCTFALSKGNDGIWAQGTKISFQAWQNFLPAQGAKKKSRMETKRNQNKN